MFVGPICVMNDCICVITDYFTKVTHATYRIIGRTKPRDRFQKHIATQTSTDSQSGIENNSDHEATEPNNIMKDTEWESSGSQSDVNTTKCNSANTTWFLDTCATPLLKHVLQVTIFHGYVTDRQIDQRRVLTKVHELCNTLANSKKGVFQDLENESQASTSPPTIQPMEASLNETIELDDTITDDSETANLPGGDSERWWIPFGLSLASWTPVSYSQMSTMELQPPKATPLPCSHNWKALHSMTGPNQIAETSAIVVSAAEKAGLGTFTN
ncbi:hypothetical protein OUZ56_012286 [Daphnia magna]|uniref:Uncharacterized protein n=1 Tax=Daphnia magna TaxID=35525 RepID=A0ABQ9Z2J4_9CRUS|nr:hypothetical protein OUZ56_012286 [Daphnia magna]